MGGVIRDYLSAVRTVLASDPRHLGTVLVGSYASGDFDPRHSDLDVIAVFREALPEAARRRLTSALEHEALPCPAHGLDLLAYRRSEARHPSPELEYEFSIATGPEWDDDISFGGRYPGGLIDLAAARQFGTTLEGAEVESLVGPVQREWVDDQLLQSLHWHLDQIHDPFHDPLGTNAVLNACRAVHFIRTGSLVSKTAGAAAFLHHPDADLVTDALRVRRSPGPSRLDRDRVVGFLTKAVAAFDVP